MRRGTVICLVGVMAVLAVAGIAWSASAPTGPDPVVKEWPEWPYLTQCGYGLPFDPVAAFSGATGAEKGMRPSEVALRSFINRGDLPWLRSTRHRRTLAEDDDQAEFVRGRLAGELEWLSFRNEGGQWKFSSYSSDCEPTSLVGRGSVVSWTLAPPISKARAAVRRIRVHLGPGPCNSGKPQNPRARIVFKKWRRKLLMIAWLKPSRGGTCEGTFEPPLTVTLPRKIQLFRLLDGSTYPPTPAIERDRG